jgi:DNA-binding CsgD family transcriptional regulator
MRKFLGSPLFESVEPLGQFPARQLLAALENSPIGVAICDRHLRFTAVNRSLAEMNNVPPDEHLGRTIHEILGSFALQAEPPFKHVFSTGRPLYNVALSGQLPMRPGVVHRLVNYFPIEDDCGRVMQAGAFVIDLSRPRTHLDQKRVSPGAAMSTVRYPSLPAVVIERMAASKAYHASNMDQHRLPFLTPRETDVLRLLAGGKSSKEASVSLEISAKTVETYRSRLMLKLHTTSLANLVHYAIRHHVVVLQG